MNITHAFDWLILTLSIVILLCYIVCAAISFGEALYSYVFAYNYYCYEFKKAFKVLASVTACSLIIEVSMVLIVKIIDILIVKI